MDQRNFDFNNDESNPLYLALDLDRQQSLLDRMAALITQVFLEQEKIHHDRSHKSNQDQY